MIGRNYMITGGCWSILVGWTAFWAWLRWTPSGISWHFFPSSVHLLFGSAGLRLYAQHPEFQFGPLTSLVVAPLTALPPAAGLVVAQLLMTAAGPFALWLVAPLAAAPGPRRSCRVLPAGIVLAPAWTILSVRWAHTDDVLTLVLLAAAVRAVHARRGLPAGLLLGAALAAKPWAIGCAPILLALPRRGAVRALPAAGLVALAAWAPFLAADAGTWSALRPSLQIADSSPLRLFGVRSAVVPPWTRSVQLLAAPLAGLLAVLRRRWPAALLVAIAVRLALDPQDIGYYAAGGVLAAVIADFGTTDRLVPWTAVITAVALWQPFVADYGRRLQVSHGPALWWFEHPSLVAAVHVGWALITLAMLLAPDRSRPAGPGRLLRQ